jgi:hypothetical protein
MEDTLTTPTEDGDVIETEEQVSEDQQVESTEVEETVEEETTTVDEYDKAWESVDLNNPSEGLFGDTTVDTETTVYSEDQTIEQGEEVQQVDSQGLLIKNPKLKYKGREIPIDSEEEAINLMQKGFKLENEMAKIKPYKAFINILDNGSITIEDLKTLDDALSGNEQAKQYLASKLGVKSTGNESTGFFDEVDETPTKEVEYKPEVPVQDPVMEYFSTITEENPEVAGRISQVYSDIDDEFKREIYDPRIFPMFASSVANGEFDELYPLAMKERVNNPALTWLEAYQMAGKRRGTQEPKTEIPSKSTKVPKTGTQSRRPAKDNYDRYFNMDMDELENRLFN